MVQFRVIRLPSFISLHLWPQSQMVLSVATLELWLLMALHKYWPDFWHFGKNFWFISLICKEGGTLDIWYLALRILGHLTITARRSGSISITWSYYWFSNDPFPMGLEYQCINRVEAHPSSRYSYPWHEHLTMTQDTFAFRALRSSKLSVQSKS